MSLRALLWKDLRREWRSKEALQAGMVLVALFLVLYLFAFDDLSAQPATAAVVLWSPVLYATAAVAGRGSASEADRGTLVLLQLAPGSRVWHGVSRTLVDLLLLSVLGGATLLLTHFIFGVPVGTDLVLVFFLGVVGMAVIGSLAGALASQARARDLLLPMLMIPVLIPLLQAGLEATQEAFSGSVDRLPLLILAGYDIVAAGTAWLLWPPLLEVD